MKRKMSDTRLSKAMYIHFTTSMHPLPTKIVHIRFRYLYISMCTWTSLYRNNYNYYTITV